MFDVGVFLLELIEGVKGNLFACSNGAETEKECEGDNDESGYEEGEGDAVPVDKELKVGDEGGVFGEGCISVEIASDVVFEGGDVGIAFVGMNGEALHRDGREGGGDGGLYGVACGGG